MIKRLLLFGFCFLVCFSSMGQEYGLVGTNSLALPQTGDHQLRVLTPKVLELTLTTTKSSETAAVSDWNFVGSNFVPQLPATSEFVVTASGEAIPITRVGFKRRPLYAPLKQRDLRILSHLYLELGQPIPSGAQVEVRNPSGKFWKKSESFRTAADPHRFSPVLHVNQVGYQTEFPKQAMVGYYLGTLGELAIPADKGFSIIEAKTGKVVHEGPLQLRPDKGFTYTPAPYQAVYEADFSSFKTPGKYRLAVEGLGASFPFQIHDGTLAAFVRTYALGLYHQRCGTNNVLPYTRFTHDACHTAPALVPDKTFTQAQAVIAEVSTGAKDDPRHTALQLNSTDASLYPFVRTGKIDVAGGHHDAGDYSKYTINSAGLVHSLIFAVDNFTGVGALDNLGLPESGDGKSDLLQEAKWEADFLARMQDQDGGYYFLVYPKERRYEDDVLPDKGDTQIVWPKTTSATAAAVAALAEAGSSPLMKKQFPEAAELYMTRALRGWAFLVRAIDQYGKDGSYQRLTHYGNEFLHDDELAWAAAAMFAATGKAEYEARLKEWFNPSDVRTLRWSWWPLFEGFGGAARTYAFAARSERLQPDQLDSIYLTKCESLIHTAAQNHVRFARETAYGTSFPDPNKANRNAGWFFSSERAFDITVAYQLRKDNGFLEAVMSNLNYEAGCNPVNVSYITGLGERRQRDIVHQYAQNDHRLLPPSGIPIGNIQAGFAYLYHYKKELGEIPFPPDGATSAPYPFYDRWGDSFNTTTEFVVVDQGRSLASLAFWMAQTPLKDQPWKAAPATVVGLPEAAPVGEKVTARLAVTGADPNLAEIVWEARDQQSVEAQIFQFTPRNVGEQWVEAEACWPDGRRAFAITSFTASASLDTPPNIALSSNLPVTEATAALYHFDEGLTDASGKNPALKLIGNATLDGANLSWMKERHGKAVRFKDLGDKVAGSVIIPPGGKEAITLQAMIFINDFKGYNRGNAKILSLAEEYSASLELIEDVYVGQMIRGGTLFSVGKSALTNVLKPRTWHLLAISVSPSGYSVSVDGKVVVTHPQGELGNWGRKPSATLEIGNFDGYIDELAVLVGGSSNVETPGPAPTPDPIPTPHPDTPPKAPSFVKNLTARDPLPFVAGKPNAYPLTIEAATQGNWEGKYGASGYKIIGSGEKLPAGASITTTGAETYTWTSSTSDPRALRKPGTTEGLASCWYGDRFEVEITPASSEPQILSAYFLDWDNSGRAQNVKMVNAGSGAVLDEQVVQKFNGGKYVSWIISGPVKMQLVKRSGNNAVVMGFFFDPLSPEAKKIVNP